MVRTKARKEASLFVVVLTALGTAFIGIVLGFSHEVARPGVFGNSASDAEEAAREHSPLFLAAESRSGTNGQAVLGQLTEGRTGTRALLLSEGDLNQIAGQYLDFTTTKNQFLSRGEAEPNFAILPETPVFALGGKNLQLTVPFEVYVFGLVREGVLVLDGTFENTSSSPRFKISGSWINSARLPAPLAKIIAGNLADSYTKQAEESPLIAGWKNLAKLNVADRKLTLEVR